jgi:hypothetical protein
LRRQEPQIAETPGAAESRDARSRREQRRQEPERVETPGAAES